MPTDLRSAPPPRRTVPRLRLPPRPSPLSILITSLLVVLSLLVALRFSLPPFNPSTTTSPTSTDPILRSRPALRTVERSVPLSLSPVSSLVRCDALTTERTRSYSPEFKYRPAASPVIQGKGQYY